MPTEILRRKVQPPAVRDERERAAQAAATDRYVLIRAGAVSVTARLRDTPTADRIWFALPIFSTAQVWGQGEVFFETPVESGRERTARMIVRPGEIVFAPDRDVIGIPFAPSPTSRSGELRLWSPSNIWAKAFRGVRVFEVVRPEERAVQGAQPNHELSETCVSMCHNLTITLSFPTPHRLFGYADTSISVTTMS